MGNVTSTGVSLGGLNAGGSVASLLLQNNFDPRCCRPFIMNGRSYYSKQIGWDTKTSKPIIQNVPTTNAATLRREDWIMIDQAVVTAVRCVMGLLLPVISLW